MTNHKDDHGGREGRSNDPANDNERATAPAPVGGTANDNKRAAPAGGAANDNGAVAPAPAGSVLASLAALSTALNKVDIGAIAGRSGLPLMQFKSRENNGTWSFGQRRTVPENGSRWAINPLTYMWGYVGFDESRRAHERLVPVSHPKPEIADLPDLGFKWQEQMAVNMKCLDGADAGTDVVFKSATDGGVKAIAGSLAAVRDRLNGGEHDGKVSPIALLEKDWYPHPERGRTWFPLITIVEWMALSGPAPAPGPAPPPPASPPPPANDQPRRRRVA
jgi:hypothetical protein